MSSKRKNSLEKLSNPQQLDALLIVVTYKAWITLFVLLALSLAVILWSIFGSISITLEGRGILTNPQGMLYNVTTEESGTVRQIDVKAGEFIEKGALIAEIFDFQKESKLSGNITADPAESADDFTSPHEHQVYSPYSGRVLEVLSNVGDRVEVGSALVWMEYSSPEKAPYYFYGYFPLEQGKRLLTGMKVNIELSTIDSHEYGHLTGTVQSVSKYAVSKESISKIVHSKELIDYLTWGTQAVVEVLIDVKKKAGAFPENPDEYDWSSGKIPPIAITSGTVCKIQAIIERVRPIYYILPLSSFKRSEEIIPKSA